MITYPNGQFLGRFNKLLKDKTSGLPPYYNAAGKHEGVDYSNADYAFALDVTLLVDLPYRRDYQTPSKRAEILLVERGSGHGVIGSFKGVTGYISNTDVASPIAHTLQAELAEECSIGPDVFESIDFRVGPWTTERRTRRPGASIVVVPILGICQHKPDITVDGREVTSYKWVALNKIAHEKQLARNHLAVTLPSVFAAIGFNEKEFKSLTGQ